jgi:hypothetical protein
LGQEEDHLPYAIYFISKDMSPAELNYTVTEKEFLAVIYAINKFRHYITGYSTFVHTDHSAIKYLMNKPITNVLAANPFFFDCSQKLPTPLAVS